MDVQLSKASSDGLRIRTVVRQMFLSTPEIAMRAIVATGIDIGERADFLRMVVPYCWISRAAGEQVRRVSFDPGDRAEHDGTA